MDKFDYAQNLYHPEKDNMPGAYEWWYFDADLDNGYSMTIVFMGTEMTGSRYIEALKKLSLNPALPYNALDYAAIRLELTDKNHETIFQILRDVPADQIQINPNALDVSFGDKCHLIMQDTAGLPNFVIDIEMPDEKGNMIKVDAAFRSLVEGVKIGSGSLLDLKSDNGHLYHKWITTMPNGLVKAHIKYTDRHEKNITLHETGYGYHDHNWGNHPLVATIKDWYWGRIAEKDMTLVFSKVYNRISDATYRPCLLTSGSDILSATEHFDFIEDKIVAGPGNAKYAEESTVRFLEGSGVSGEVKIKKPIITVQDENYKRFRCDYYMDVVTMRGPIKCEGKMRLEYMDLSAIKVG